MKNVIALLALLLPLASGLRAAEPELPPTHPSKENFHLFLLAGQSNMAGRGRVDKKNNAPHPRVFTFTKGDTWTPAIDPLYSDSPHAGVGIGKRFGEIVADSNPQLTIGLIPTAVGGTPIRHWMSDGGRYKDSIAQAKKAMESGTLKAILWHQGESDSREGYASLYEKRLREVIANFRKDLDAPSLPFFIGQLGQFPKTPWDEPRRMVDAAQRRVAETTPNVFFISSDGLTGGGQHFNTKGYLLFAEAYAKAYLDLPKNP